MRKSTIVNAIFESCISPATFAANMLKWKEITFTDIRDHASKFSWKDAQKLKKILVAEKCLKPKSKRYVKTPGFIKILESLC